jgi:peptide/nickel transport system substrate-binding protein
MKKRILALALALVCVGSMAFAAGDAPLRVIIIPPARLTPGYLVDGAGAIFASFVYDWLFRINGQTGKVEPSLVESYTVSPDAKVWTMKLRKGIKFHHGTVFTADDVVYTVNRWLDKKLGTAPYGVFNGLLQKVEKTDQYTVKFTLTQTDVEFYLKFLDYNTPMLAHDYDNDGLGETKPSGTGAFQVETLVPKERVVFAANKSYWVSGAPGTDKVELLFIPDTETEVKMMESGQADVVTDLSVDQYKRLNSNPNTKGLFIKLGHHVALSMRTDIPPFNDVRLRTAMKLVVDRQKMLDSVMFGMGSLGNDSPVAPFNPFYDDLGGVRQRDIEKAKALLAEAGYTDKNPLSVTLYTSSNTPPELDVALTFQQMAKDAGIDVEISTSPRDVYYAKHWLKETFTGTLWGHREDVTQLLRLAYMTGGPWNEGHYSNPELDKNIQLATSTTDTAKRMTYFKNIQQILHDDGPTIISFFQPYFGATSKRITDFYLTRNWINDYRFMKLVQE